MIDNRLAEKDLYPREESIGPILVSFVSGKGGVGKSTIAFNLSAVAARAGYRTLIADCDWNFGNVHILANVVPTMTLGDVVKNEVYASEARVQLGENWHMLASPSCGPKGMDFSGARIIRFFHSIRKLYHEYDYIILDTGTGDIGTIITAASVSDINIIVINPELTSIADGYGLFKHLVNSGNETMNYILVNFVECPADHAFIYQKFAFLAQKFLNKVPLNAGFLMNDREVIESVAHQVALQDMKGGTPAVEYLNRLLKLLTKERKIRFSNSRFNQPTSIKSMGTLADIGE